MNDYDDKLSAVSARFGALFWPITYKVTRSDEEVSVILKQQLDGQELGPREKPNEPMQDGFHAVKWVDCGCPRLLIDDKFAALMISTDVKSDDDIQPPYDAFEMRVPKGLLLPKGGGDITFIQVFRCKIFGEYLWSYRAVAANVERVAHTEFEHPTVTYRRVLVKSKDLRYINEDEAAKYKTTRNSHESLLTECIGKLIASTCVALSDPDMVRERKTSKGRGCKTKRLSGAPNVREFVVGKPVKIDCRQAVRDYIAGETGKGNKLTVQTLVRGHWRNQAHGVGRQLRKMIHIEPFWRGPEDAKILTKTIKLTGDK